MGWKRIHSCACGCKLILLTPEMGSKVNLEIMLLKRSNRGNKMFWSRLVILRGKLLCKRLDNGPGHLQGPPACLGKEEVQ